MHPSRVIFLVERQKQIERRIVIVGNVAHIKDIGPGATLPNGREQGVMGIFSVLVVELHFNLPVR